MKCPYCGAKDDWGMAGYRWMHRIPFMKNRRCSGCGREFARWLGRIPMQHETAHILVTVWVTLWLTTACVGFGLAVAWLVRWHHAQIH